MKSRIVWFIAFFILIVGMLFVLYPFIGQLFVDHTNKQEIQTFVEKKKYLVIRIRLI